MDAFEKELETRKQGLLDLLPTYKKHADYTSMHDLEVEADKLQQILDLYRSPSIKADRLASALEEVANTPELLPKQKLVADCVSRQFFELAARAIREKKGVRRWIQNFTVCGSNNQVITTDNGTKVNGRNYGRLAGDVKITDEGVFVNGKEIKPID